MPSERLILAAALLALLAGCASGVDRTIPSASVGVPAEDAAQEAVPDGVKPLSQEVEESSQQ